MIADGWGRRTTRVLGTTPVDSCPKCTRGQQFSLLRTRTWFTLFWIPIIPYRREHWFICNDCQAGFKLDDAEVLRVQQEMRFGIPLRIASLFPPEPDIGR
jgi:hypothetical protein